MTKYRKISQEMFNQHQELFKSFEEIHAQYALDPEMWQEEFNAQGEKVLEVAREYENRLCSKSQGTGYAAFTSNLAEKFQDEVRARFPLINRVGIKKAATTQAPEEKPNQGPAPIKPKLSTQDSRKSGDTLPEKPKPKPKTEKQVVQKRPPENQEDFKIPKIEFS